LERKQCIFKRYEELPDRFQKRERALNFLASSSGVQRPQCGFSVSFWKIRPRVAAESWPPGRSPASNFFATCPTFPAVRPGTWRCLARDRPVAQTSTNKVKWKAREALTSPAYWSLPGQFLQRTYLRPRQRLFLLRPLIILKNIFVLLLRTILEYLFGSSIASLLNNFLADQILAFKRRATSGWLLLLNQVRSSANPLLVFSSHFIKDLVEFFIVAKLQFQNETVVMVTLLAHQCLMAGQLSYAAEIRRATDVCFLYFTKRYYFPPGPPQQSLSRYTT